MTGLARQAFFSPLAIFSFGISGLIALPLLYVGYSALNADLAVWQRLWTTRIPELFFNTVSLAFGVGLLTLILGVSLAWFITRYDFWGRRFWEWAFVLPLAIPSYVLAYVYTFLLDTGGPLEQIWQVVLGPQAPFFSPYSFTGALMVMTLNTFPYVYLLSKTALQNFNVTFEEAAKATGASQWATLTQVFLPLIRPALVAGLFLVILYVVSDFGAVSLLRFQTFTYAVYQQMTGRYDYGAASILSLLLVSFALIFLLGERWFRKQSRFYQMTGKVRPLTLFPCSFSKTAIISGYCVMVFGLAFALPAYWLVRWTSLSWAENAIGAEFLGYVGNSVVLSGGAATLALVLGTPLAYLACRRPTRLNMLVIQGAYTGYVLPGPVAALALLILFANIPFLYGTALVLVLAYLIHYLPAGLQSLESSIQQVNPNLEEAAKSLGTRSYQAFQRVTFPLIRGGFLVAWIFMFLQCMKELPATLLLRPVGFDTLAVRIWLEASEELYQLAAPPALLIVMVTIPVILLLTRKNWQVG